MRVIANSKHSALPCEHVGDLRVKRDSSILQQRCGKLRQETESLSLEVAHVVVGS